MTPTTQTILHLEEPGRHGNCLQAAIATILDLPLDSVPHFAQYDNADYEHLWWDALVGWASRRGLRVLFSYSPVETRCLVIGTSPRGFGHVCVGSGLTVEWDPHPSRAGLIDILGWITFESVAPAC